MLGTAPRFWWSAHPTWPARFLAPAAGIYGSVAGRRMNQPGRRMGVPVLCIGNFVVGGAGKTPTAIEVARRLLARGAKPAFLSRGYGRTAKRSGFVAVDPTRHGAGEVGDEPLLLARVAPTFVAADRVLAAEAAVAGGASVLLMDDGLQSPALAKDAVLAVVDGATGIGNGFCLPAGPLRAPMRRQWAKVSLLCVIGAGEGGDRTAAQAETRGIPIARARLDADPAALKAIEGRRLLAFSGIARPEKFFETLENHALSVVARRVFPDHHRYGLEDRQALLRDAELFRAELVTTEKDAARLAPSFPVHVLPVSLAFESGASALDGLLAGLQTLGSV